jgi:hypothetical protein
MRQDNALPAVASLALSSKQLDDVDIIGANAKRRGVVPHRNIAKLTVK